jgi:DNA topoisomerase I
VGLQNGTATDLPGGATPLRLVCDFQPGLHREGSPGQFTYFDDAGRRVEEPAELDRIRGLAIPPAWTMVWIAPDGDAHLQATGVDSRGRKQYRYHPDWLHERDHLKFHDMEGFAQAQPRLRRRIDESLDEAGEPLSHRQVLALSLRLLDIGLLRVGSDRYARDNKHYGLTTLLRHQVTVRSDSATFDFVGKAGKRHRIAISDGQALGLLALLRRRRAGPPELLVYRGRHGWTRIHREDVNNFLRVTADGPFSAKEYRTWNATVIAAATLAARQPPASRAEAVASQAVSAALGNTPTVARKSYIDPRVFDRFAAGSAISLDGLPTGSWQARTRIERRVLALLGGSRSLGRVTVRPRGA